MADRMAAEIWIGGPIPEPLVEALCGHIRDEALSLDYGEASFEPHDAEELLRGAAENDGLLRLCDDEVAWGEFRDLEGWLQEHGIPYTRRSDGKYEHDPVVVEFRPEEGLHEMVADKALRPVIPVSEVRDAANILRTAADLMRENSFVQGARQVSLAFDKLQEALPPELPPLPPLEIVADTPEAPRAAGGADRLPYPLDKAAKAHPNGERWVVSVNRGPIAVVIRVEAEEGLREAYADAIVEAINARVAPQDV